MPNFDGGHYFLTALIPVKGGNLDDEKFFTSHAHALRSRLARLPPALQSPANEARGVNSPFALSSRTHFARLFVIEDVAFNGRVGHDTLVVAIGTALKGLWPSLAKLNPLAPQPVDQLPNPYLVFIADFDAANGSDGELDAYLAELWSVMSDDLAGILSHCHGFDRVDSAEAFTRAMHHCQIETTMPFNDYWQQKLDLGKLGMSLLGLLAPPIVAFIALIVGIVGWMIADDPTTWRWVSLIAAAGFVVTLLWAYWGVLRNGAKPLPSAPDCDLKSVLKALYIQQKFVRFAIDTQGANPAALHAAFGTFLKDHKPADVTGPTQKAGVVRSR